MPRVHIQMPVREFTYLNTRKGTCGRAIEDCSIPLEATAMTGTDKGIAVETRGAAKMGAHRLNGVQATLISSDIGAGTFDPGKRANRIVAR